MKKINILITSFIIIFTISGCNLNNSKEESVLKLANSRIYSADIIGTPWKNQILATSLMYRSLFMTDIRDMTESNDLVEYYEVSEDMTRYSFKIREDIVWSDGKALSLNDIIFSIKGILLADNVNGIYQTAFSNIVGAEEFINLNSIDYNLEGLSKEDGMLNINLKRPVSNIIQVLAQFAILPEHCFIEANIQEIDKDDYWKNPVVSGVFKVEEMVANDYIKLVFNDKYVGKEPKIKVLMLYENYEEEELDLYSTTNITEILEYRALSNMKEYSINSLFYRYLVFNINKDGEIDEIINDIRFREAIKYAINRKEIINEIYYGAGTIINTGILIDDYELYPNEEIYYNQEKAKELLVEMDFDFNKEINIYSYYEDAVSKLFTDKLKKQLEEIGLNINVVESSDKDLYAFNDYDISLKGISAFDYIDWYTEYLSGNAFNINLIGGDILFDDLVNGLSSTSSLEEKINILDELQILESEILYKLPLFTLPHMVYINEDRLLIPEGIEFGNTWYKYDMEFEEWEIK
ncbi:MAG: ABC transporter substrate-binding protein [bacterium]